jgi:hypothetical protein
MARPIELSYFHQSLEEVAVRAGHEVLMEVDSNSALIVGNPQGILGEHLRPRPIHWLNINYHLIKILIMFLLN